MASRLHYLPKLLSRNVITRNDLSSIDFLVDFVVFVLSSDKSNSTSQNLTKKFYFCI